MYINNIRADKFSQLQILELEVIPLLLYKIIDFFFKDFCFLQDTHRRRHQLLCLEYFIVILTSIKFGVFINNIQADKFFLLQISELEVLLYKTIDILFKDFCFH